jgi:hypothetical protein
MFLVSLVSFVYTSPSSVDTTSPTIPNTFSSGDLLIGNPLGMKNEYLLGRSQLDAIRCIDEHFTSVTRYNEYFVANDVKTKNWKIRFSFY